MDPSDMFWILVITGLMIVICAGAFSLSRWLRRNPSPRDQRRAFRWVALVMAGLAAVQLTIALAGGSFGWTQVMMMAGAASPAVIYLMLSVRRHTKDEEQANYAYDQRLCGRCDYDLTGNVSGVCPECGWKIPDVPVRLVDPDWTKWWKRWDIEYIDHLRSRLVSVLIGALGFIAMGVLVAVLYPEIWPAMLLMLGMSIHLGIIAIRLYQYGQSTKARDRDLLR